MKRSILMLLVMSAALIFFGCEKETIPAPGSDLNDQEESALKAKKVRKAFEGTCTQVFINGELIDPIALGTVKNLPNGKVHHMGYIAEWYDHSPTEPLVTGASIWYANYFWDGAPFGSNAKVFGKTEIFLDDDLGKWDLTWHGYLTFSAASGLTGYVDAIGVGKSGEVKGMTGKWKYTLAFDLLHGGPYYITTGYIK